METNIEKYNRLWNDLNSEVEKYVDSVLPNPPKVFYEIGVDYTKYPGGCHIRSRRITEASYSLGIYHNHKKRQTAKDIEELKNKIVAMPDFDESKIFLHWQDGNTSGAIPLKALSEPGKSLNPEDLKEELQKMIDLYSPKPGHIACEYCRHQRRPDDLVYKTIISPNWKDRGFRSPPRPYCKDRQCWGHDQMAHEG